LIGAGGVANGWQAYTKILVGADLVQLYSGLALEGPHLPARILYQLTAMMDADGITSPHQIKGQIPDPAKAIKYAQDLYKKILEQ
jgi:dihydroorotate dehydrogenase